MSATLFASYTTVTEQYTVTDHVPVLISRFLQCGLTFRRRCAAVLRIISNRQSTDRLLGFNLVHIRNRSGSSRGVLTSTASQTMHKAHTKVSQTSVRSTLTPRSWGAARAIHKNCTCGKSGRTSAETSWLNRPEVARCTTSRQSSRSLSLSHAQPTTIV